MNSAAAMNELCAEWLNATYSRGRIDCVQFVLAYMEKVGVEPLSPVSYSYGDEFTVDKVIAALGKPLPNGVDGDVILSKQALALNPQNGEYVLTILPEDGDVRMSGFACVPLSMMTHPLQWQVAKDG